MSSLVIVDNYDSFTYNLYQMVQAATSLPVHVVRNDAMTFDALMSTYAPVGFILSPGPGTPDNPADFGVCAEVIDRYDTHQRPVLGVCLGHQGLASRHGATVTHAPHLMHGKASNVRILQPHPLLDGLPNPFAAMRYHSLVVQNDTLPSSFHLLARDEDHGLIMVIAHKDKALYGVQFHPESIGTPQGGRLLANFIALLPTG